MKQMILFLSLVIPFFSVSAQWKNQSIKGLSTLIYLPKIQTDNTQKKALMVNLHGCAQKADDLKIDGNWETTADEYNMIVVLPRVPNGGVYSGCWDYYGADHTTSNRHNGPIIEMVKDLLARPELNIDPEQVYVSGLSSGGGESMIMGCLAPDLFAGMGLNAAPSTGTSAQEINRIQTSVSAMLATCKKLAGTKSDLFKTQMTSIIYGNNDYIVSTAHDTNNAQIMSTIYGATVKSTFDTKKLEGALTDGTGTLFSDDKGPRVSLIMNTVLGHNWPAGQGGNGGNFISKKSINYPAYITKFFFQNNRRSQSVKMPEVLVAPIVSENFKFKVSGSLTISNRLVKAIEVTVKDKVSNEVVDRFKVLLNKNGYFEGNSKVLNSGEYSFTLKLTDVSGLAKLFNRQSWMGEVPGVMSPQLVNVNFQSVNDCISLSGQAVNNGGDKLTGVHIELDRKEIGLADVQPTTQWLFKSCGLSIGAHELSIFAANESNLRSNIQSLNFQTDLDTATSSLQTHMEAGRLPWAEFGQWYLKYGNQTFTLYLWTDRSWKDERQLIKTKILTPVN
jgi:poly(hydroxyalkanoate) depolymerase family esterase